MGDARQCWGQLDATESIPIPWLEPSIVPWPNLFIGSQLFRARPGTAALRNVSLTSLDGEEMRYSGEQLQSSIDGTLLKALLVTAGRSPCGRLVRVTIDDIEAALGCRLPELGIPIHYDDVAKSVWRLATCSLSVPAIGFVGPLLAYADVAMAPQYRIRLNPALPRLFSADRPH